MIRDIERFGVWCGIGYVLTQIAVLVVLTATVLVNVPPPGAAAAERAAAFVAQGDALRVGNWLMLLPVPLLLVFAAAAGARVRHQHGGGDALAFTIVGAAAAMAMMWPIGGAVSTIALLIARDGGDPVVSASLDAIAPFTLALSAAPRAVFVAALAFGMAGSGRAGRWLAWSGYVVAALSLVGSATLAFDGMFPALGLSTLLFLVWTGGAAALLLRASSEARVQAATASR